MPPLHWLPLACLACLAACVGAPDSAPDPDTLQWTPWSSAALGVSLEVPAGWSHREDGNTAAFRGAEYTMRVTLADRGEAKDRGLWGRTPVLRVDTVGGLSFAFYRYRHYDGPFYEPTLAFVVGHRGRELGIEFRTRAEGIGAFERRVLESVHLR